MKLTKSEKKSIIRDLKKYFNHTKECVKCKNIYGTDTNKDNGLCPVCDKMLRNNKK